MSKNRLGSKRTPDEVASRGPERRRETKPERFCPARLHRVEGGPPTGLNPGEILLLCDTGRPVDLQENAFYAVLACPRCGNLIPVTAPQFLGALPLMCGSNLCCCRFRIADKNRLVYLQVV